jgi:hypothetical protein
MDRNALIARLESTGKQFADHARAGAAELARRYGPGKWTVGEILAHLADAEAVGYWRFVRTVCQPGEDVGTFDQERWAHTLDYAHRPAAVSGAMLQALRGALVHHVRTLADDVLDRSGTHPEKGTLSGWEWADLIAAHTEHHLDQIVAARAGTPWKLRERPDSWRYRGLPRPG